MADLLQYLIPSSPTHRIPSSQHSRTGSMEEVETFSTPRESPHRLMASEEYMLTAGTTTNGIVATSDGGAQGVVEDELPIFDIDDPRMQALLNSVPLPRRAAAQVQPSAAASSKAPTSSTTTPVRVGKTHSAAHVIEFYKLCGERNLTPNFIFTGIADRAEFGVRVEFGGHSVLEEGPFASKKEAKEVAAEKGVEVLREVPLPEKAKEGENWVGILSEYCTIEDIPQPSFTDYAIGPQFACEATIAKRPNEPFGGCDSAFPSKKAAKANAAKEAVFWLRQNGHMSEGPLKKKRKIAGAILAEGPGAVAGNGDKGTMSNAQKVNELCPLLGLNSPEYRFTQDYPGFHSGAAYFPRDPEIQGPVGEIRKVHGIKQAKNECAREVLLRLQEIIKKRGIRLEDVI